MDQRVLLLAHIAMLQFDRLAPRDAFVIGIDNGIGLRREIILRREHRPGAQLADARRIEQRIILADLRIDTFALGRLHALAPGDRIRVIDACNRLVQQHAIGIRQLLKQAPVFSHLKQRGSRSTQAVIQIRSVVGSGCFWIFSRHGKRFTNGQPHMIACNPDAVFVPSGTCTS